jgi:hypothetical protein
LFLVPYKIFLFSCTCWPRRFGGIFGIQHNNTNEICNCISLHVVLSWCCNPDCSTLFHNPQCLCYAARKK